MSEPFIESTFCKQDINYEVPLRPQVLSDFTGQNKVKAQLGVLIQAAKKRGEHLPHILLSGPPGLGKTTLSHIIAKEIDASIVVTSGPVIEKAGDLAGILTNLKEGDILFIDEIHRLNRVVEEYLYSAMEDFQLDLVIDSGSNARSVSVKLNAFTLIGATTKSGLLSAPLRSRFPASLRLDYYQPEDLKHIVKRTASLLSFASEDDAFLEVARRSRGTARIANNLLRWVRDYAEIHSKEKKASKNTIEQALSMLEIDEKGLDEIDMRLLRILIDHYKGGPVGLQTLSMACGEEMQTIEEVHEPFLIMQGLLPMLSLYLAAMISLMVIVKYMVSKVKIAILCEGPWN